MHRVPPSIQRAQDDAEPVDWGRAVMAGNAVKLARVEDASLGHAILAPAMRPPRGDARSRSSSCPSFEQWNLTVQVHGNGEAFTVKVSDFGLAKEKGSDLTSTGSVMKGSIRDPFLESFGDLKPVNDIFAIGFILNYILTGKENLVTDGSRPSSIIQKCSAEKPSGRYQTVEDIIEDMKRLEYDRQGAIRRNPSS